MKKPLLIVGMVLSVLWGVSCGGGGGGSSTPRSNLVANSVSPATSDVIVGELLSVNYDIDNAGTADTGTFDVKFYLSVDNVYDAGDTQVASVNTSIIAGGSEVTNTPAATSGVAPGDYYLIMVADTGDVEAESNETDNEVASVATVTLIHRYLITDLLTGGESTAESVSDLLTNDDYKTTKVVLRLIDAGAFQMGDEVGGHDASELPVHTVTLTNRFYIGVFEVTQRQWFEVEGNWPSGFSTSPDKRPVETVSWPDCQGFIAQLNTETGSTYRMPTEAEWEYACKAGTSTNFSYGTTPDAAYMWYGQTETTEVGSKFPNPWSLYDMHGNIWEFCEDWYDAGYYSVSPGTDPQGPGTALEKCYRGGAWGIDAADYRRSSCRGYGYNTANGVGLRLVRPYVP